MVQSMFLLFYNKYQNPVSDWLQDLWRKKFLMQMRFNSLVIHLHITYPMRILSIHLVLQKNFKLLKLMEAWEDLAISVNIKLLKRLIQVAMTLLIRWENPTRKHKDCGKLRFSSNTARVDAELDLLYKKSWWPVVTVVLAELDVSNWLLSKKSIRQPL